MVKLNLGAGPDRKTGWVNVDNGVDDGIWHVPLKGKHVKADVFDYLAGAAGNTADEVYAGHFLEHFEYGLDDWETSDAHRLLAECFRVLKPGGHVGIVVPDIREVMRGYFTGGRDLDDICAAFLYSTVQPSRHLWSWDATTLRRALERAGFQVVDEIDRYDDERLAAGAWFQVGLDAVKPKEETMSNVAPEHGETPFGAVGDGGPISATTAGTRPPVPHDPIGTVTAAGPESMRPLTDPGDPDNDMDSEAVDDIGL